MLNTLFGSTPTKNPQETMMDDQIPLNDIPEMPDVNQGGYAINLIVAVKDHAPPRIDNIEKEVAEMQNRIKELETERALLIKLLQVVTE